MKVAFQLSAATLLLAVALVFQSASGFSAAAPATTPRQHRARATTTTQLNAWSLPATNKFGTFSTSWFDVKDPTGRKVVYNDDAESSEWSYSFVTSLGDDWPSTDEDIASAATMQEQQQQQPQQQSRRVRALKRVTAWWRKNAAASAE